MILFGFCIKQTFSRCFIHASISFDVKILFKNNVFTFKAPSPTAFDYRRCKFYIQRSISPMTLCLIQYSVAEIYSDHFRDFKLNIFRVVAIPFKWQKEVVCGHHITEQQHCSYRITFVVVYSPSIGLRQYDCHSLAYI